MSSQQTVTGECTMYPLFACHSRPEWEADGNRSPSPPPQYDNFGRRVNTREYRYKKRLEEERHKLIEKAMKIIPGYHPPSDYRRPTKTQEKVYVPVNDYPEINFSMIANPLTSNLFPCSILPSARLAALCALTIPHALFSHTRALSLSR